MRFRTAFKYPKDAASDAEIAHLAKWAGGHLPSAYEAFLRETNGAEHGPVSDNLALWGAQEVAELTPAYGAPEWVPGLILIGSDGGGEAVALDTRDQLDPAMWPVVRVPFGDLEFESCIELATSFDAWADAGFPLREDL